MNKSFENEIRKSVNLKNVVCFDSIPSTNDYLKELAKSGENTVTLALAKTQTAGKGRLSKNFVSEMGGAYFSLLFFPDLKAEDGYLLTVLAAVCAMETVEEISGKKCLIKWVNDIYLDNKKVCGILCESATETKSGNIKYAVLGVGINVFSSCITESIKDIATSVFNDRKYDETEISKIISVFCNKFLQGLETLSDKAFIEKYRKNSYLDGKEIQYVKNGQIHCATVLGIDDKCRLTIEEDGKNIKLFSGDITIGKNFKK